MKALPILASFLGLCAPVFAADTPSANAPNILFILVDDPLIIHHPRPNGMKRSTVIPLLALNLDLPPTILALADIDLPEKYRGRSLLPLLRGSTPADWRSNFFTEFNSFKKILPDCQSVHGERYT